jgi:triosephosphate isomerase (TIM)
VPRPPTRRPVVAGNWKMNLTHLEGISLMQKLRLMLRPADTDAVDTVVLPPFTALRSVQTAIDGDRIPVGFGAQDLSQHDNGAYTGDISGLMLAALGAHYVTVGHSERRAYHHEDDTIVAAKVRAAYRHGLTPILCVGESLDIRQDGRQIPHTVGQVQAAVSGLTDTQAASLIVAYEPIWAIGTGETATPDDAQEMSAALRAALATTFTPALAGSVRILYGGSVNADNAADLFAGPDVDGGLIGGASLNADAFVTIVRAAVAKVSSRP